MSTHHIAILRRVREKFTETGEHGRHYTPGERERCLTFFDGAISAIERGADPVQVLVGRVQATPLRDHHEPRRSDDADDLEPVYDDPF